ncbi:MAG: hypothetical protein CMQ43_14680 [Gammaproteobacteria bacterium]|nr:hypothetical protein [Gammaproteobacteria bacterium]MBK82151.1 hypothetical protein [Gammaproteobacteria bacterium]
MRDPGIDDMNPADDDRTPVSEEQVIVYLRNHPDFFQQHPHLLSELHLRHESGGAISLVERQVAILRERNMIMRRRMNELMQTAKQNDELFAKTRTLTLELLRVDSWHELNEVLATYVLTDFHADFVCCHLAGMPVAGRPGSGKPASLDHIVSHAGPPLPHERFVRGAYPICTTLRVEELADLFPSVSHDAAGSAVLAPLVLDAPGGCLAIGSRDPQGFTPDMDTLFVTYIAEVLSQVVQRLAP